MTQLPWLLQEVIPYTGLDALTLIFAAACALLVSVAILRLRRPPR